MRLRCCETEISHRETKRRSAHLMYCASEVCGAIVCSCTRFESRRSCTSCSEAQTVCEDQQQETLQNSHGNVAVKAVTRSHKQSHAVISMLVRTWLTAGEPPSVQPRECSWKQERTYPRINRRSNIRHKHKSPNSKHSAQHQERAEIRCSAE